MEEDILTIQQLPCFVGHVVSENTDNFPDWCMMVHDLLSHLYSFNPYINNHAEDIVVSLSWKLLKTKISAWSVNALLKWFRISHLFLIRQKCTGYRCESDMSLFQIMVLEKTFEKMWKIKRVYIYIVYHRCFSQMKSFAILLLISKVIILFL